MTRNSRRTVVYMDEASVYEILRDTFTHKNFEYVGVPDRDSLMRTLELIEIDILMIAIELKVEKDTIDFEYGIRVQNELYQRGVKRPLIFTTTQQQSDAPASWFVERGGKVKAVIIPKPKLPTLDSAIERILSDSGFSPSSRSEAEIYDECYYDNRTDLFLISGDNLFLDILAQTFEIRRYRITKLQQSYQVENILGSFKNSCGIAIFDMTLAPLRAYSLMREVSLKNPLIRFVCVGRDFTEAVKNTLYQMGLFSEFGLPIHLPDLVAHVKEIAISNGALGG